MVRDTTRARRGAKGADGARADDERLAAECVVSLVRAASRVEAELARIFRRHGLTGSGFNVLMILAGAERPLSPNEIAERRLVTTGTVTGLLDTLERQGLVRRLPHPADRRMVLVEATAKAAGVLRATQDELFPAQAAMTSPLSSREKETLVRLLAKLRPDGS